MAVYFKLSEDGRKVLVAKTLIEKELSKEEFEAKAKKISVDELIKWLPIKKLRRLRA